MSEAQVIETPPAHGPSFAVVVEIAERWSYRSCDRDRIVKPHRDYPPQPAKTQNPHPRVGCGAEPFYFEKLSCEAFE